MLNSVSELSWPSSSFCLPGLVMVLSSMVVARGRLGSSRAMVALPTPAPSALPVAWGAELHLCVGGNVISASAAVRTGAGASMGKPEQTGKAALGHQQAHFPAVFRKACFPSSAEEKTKHKPHLKSFRNNILLRNGWRLWK